MKYTMYDGAIITEKADNSHNSHAAYEYYLNGEYQFGTVERFPEEDLNRLYENGYFGNPPKTPSPRVKASIKYDKANVKQVKLSLNKKTDADIIAILESKDNVQGYIKGLIRKDNEKSV